LFTTTFRPASPAVDLLAPSFPSHALRVCSVEIKYCT
jgi:hypothetical protein